MTDSLTHTPEISHHREWAPFPVLGELITCADVAGGSKQPSAATGMALVVMTNNMSSPLHPMRRVFLLLSSQPDGKNPAQRECGFLKQRWDSNSGPTDIYTPHILGGTHRLTLLPDKGPGGGHCRSWISRTF